MSTDSIVRQREIALEVERIKSQVDGTREIYRQVCGLLFFRFGITPTANGLYQLVRKGTMGTPGAVLKEFWQDIQAKARIRVDRADLRPELVELAADMVGTLWERALADADTGLDLERSQLRTVRARAEADVMQAREEVLRKQAEVVRVETQLGDSQAEIRMVGSRLAAALEGKRNHEQEVAELREEIRLRNEALDRARTDFATELAASREQAQQAAARYEEASRRSMLEIDRARTASAALQCTLDELRQRSAETEAGLREEVDRALRDVSHERHRVGVLEGKLALRVFNESRMKPLRRRMNKNQSLPSILPSSRKSLKRRALRRGIAPRVDSC
ncbi:DNA-binding protein [Paraburkholderia aspalathi]|uniref:DNA-binding protein n=1 Tax=Paraburkholderia aspalathi TaxID=1324617 RepID=UPI001B0B9FA9|nr:DNA-binding protein [Paraburkholderia aspalathi]CAE6754160.1 hypothetical protein R20943_03058 [Paraburkholderia aspalathi]